MFLFNGTVLSVYNYANWDRVNGDNLNKNNFTLCARVPNANETSKLIVAPFSCQMFLVEIIGLLSVGPSQDNYDYAIVLGGQQTLDIIMVAQQVIQI